DYRKILDRNLSNELDKQSGEFELFDLANKVLFNSISEWSGINLENYDDKKLEELAENQISMISGAVTSPTDHIKGITDRNESEKWAQDLIKDARENQYKVKNILLYILSQMQLI